MWTRRRRAGPRHEEHDERSTTMSDERSVERGRGRVRTYDVGLCPTIEVQVVNGMLYAVDVDFEDPLAYVGNPATGRVVQPDEEGILGDGTDLDAEGRRCHDAARVASRIMNDTRFQADLRRVLKEALARCA